MRRESGFSKIDSCTIPLSSSLALRIYSDTKPHNSHIADLQKGLIFVHKGIETVGEGTGFGVPVLLYSDETYFSGSSHVYFCEQDNCKIIRKEFLMDKVPRKKIRETQFENRKLRAILRYLAEMYQKHRHFRLLTLENLFGNMGVHTSFVKSVPAGTVIVTYGISKDRIQVKSDSSFLNRENLEKIFMLNEQGSRFFRTYLDSNSTKLVDKQIGAWEAVGSEWASITDLHGRVGFRVWKAKDTILRRGREFLKDCRDWIGLDYEIDPKNTAFEYEIEILGANQLR